MALLLLLLLLLMMMMATMAYRWLNSTRQVSAHSCQRVCMFG